MAIAANKVAGIRAAAGARRDDGAPGREHNDANVLTLGARVLNEAQASKWCGEFLAAQFAGGRHQRRIDKISELDQRSGSETKNDHNKPDRKRRIPRRPSSG